MTNDSILTLIQMTGDKNLKALIRSKKKKKKPHFNNNETGILNTRKICIKS